MVGAEEAKPKSIPCSRLGLALHTGGLRLPWSCSSLPLPPCRLAWGSRSGLSQRGQALHVETRVAHGACAPELGALTRTPWDRNPTLGTPGWHSQASAFGSGGDPGWWDPSVFAFMKQILKHICACAVNCWNMVPFPFLLSTSSYFYSTLKPFTIFL